MLAIGRADGLNHVQGLGQALLENFEGSVLAALELFHVLAHDDGEVYDHRVHEQDEQRQGPVHPQEHCGGTDQAQHRNQELGYGGTDKIVDGIHVGDEMRRDAAAPQGFVFRHGNAFQPAQQLTPHVKNHILRNSGELAYLQGGESQSRETKQHRERQNGAHIEQRTVPGGGKDPVQGGDHDSRPGQENLVHQQRHQQRDGDCGEHRCHGDEVGDYQRAAVLPGDAEQIAPPIRRRAGGALSPGLRHVLPRRR